MHPSDPPITWREVWTVIGLTIMALALASPVILTMVAIFRPLFSGGGCGD